MNVDEFWAVVEASDRSGATRGDREDLLRRKLRLADRRDLLDFVQHLSATREPANTFRLRRAADIIMSGYCGTDSFHYFQMWLVGLGREAYGAALADPDSLAAVPQVRRLAALPRSAWQDEDYPGWESLEYVACKVGEQRDDIDGDIRDVVAEERGVRLRSDPNPEDAEWRGLDAGELSRRYPRLWVLFDERWEQEAAVVSQVEPPELMAGT